MALVPVTEGRDEVEAAVHAVVLDVLTVQSALVSEVLLELLVDVVCHRLPAEHRSKTVSQQQHLYIMVILHLVFENKRGKRDHQALYVPFSVIDGVSESWCVHDSELQLDALLLDVHRVFGDLHRLSDPLCQHSRYY